jgi:hypothetical protein
LTQGCSSLREKPWVRRRTDILVRMEMLIVRVMSSTRLHLGINNLKNLFFRVLSSSCAEPPKHSIIPQFKFYYKIPFPSPKNYVFISPKSPTPPISVDSFGWFRGPVRRLRPMSRLVSRNQGPWTARSKSKIAGWGAAPETRFRS